MGHGEHKQRLITERQSAWAQDDTTRAWKHLTKLLITVMQFWGKKTKEDKGHAANVDKISPVQWKWKDNKKNERSSEPPPEKGRLRKETPALSPPVKDVAADQSHCASGTRFSFLEETRKCCFLICHLPHSATADSAVVRTALSLTV